MDEQIRANERNWLLTAPEANPAMLGMLCDRIEYPVRDLLMWSRVFPGQHLVSAVGGLRNTQSPELRTYLKGIVADVIDAYAS